MAQNRELGDLGQLITVDPSTNNLLVSGSITVGNSTVNASLNATSVSINSTTTNTFTIGTAAYSVANGNFGIGNTAPTQKLHVQGTAFATSDFRAPLFYDSNNTAYYVDAAGTSNLNGLTVAGTINAASYTVGSVFTANSSGLTTTANVSIGAAGELIVSAGAGIYANGGLGTAGQVLHSNGSSIYWAADDNSGGTVTSVATGNGLTGGTISTTGTVSVLANSGITANTNGLFVTQGTGSVVNATGVHVNATYIGTLSANNTTYVNGKTEGNLNVNSSLYANVLLRIDDRIIIANDFPSQTLRFGFTSFNNNNTSPWADFLHMRSYSDSSGGSDNLLMFNKSAIGVRVYQAAWSNLTTGNTSAYSTYKDLAFTDASNASGTWPTANNSSYLGTYVSTDYPRKAESASVTGGWNFSSAAFVMSQHYYTNMYDSTNTYVHYYPSTGNGANNSFANLRTFTGGGGTKVLRFGGDGNLTWDGTGQASTDWRAPIFYDSNNTAYYVDPSSTSNFNNIMIEGGVASNQLAASYSQAAIEVREYNFGGAQTDSWSYAPRIGFHWGGRVASQIAMSSLGQISILNNPGNAYESFQCGNLWAPIFYDSGNSAYYCDPASSSVFNTATFAGLHTIDSNGLIARTGGGNYGVRIYPGGGSSATASILQFTNGAQNSQWGSLWFDGTAGGVGTDSAVPFYIRSNGSTRLTIDSSGNASFSGNLSVTGSGSRTLVATVTGTNVATLNYTSLSGYRSYEIEFDSLVPITQSRTLCMQLHGGGAFLTGNYYNAVFTYFNNNSSGGHSSSGTFIYMTYPAYFITAATGGTGMSGTFTIYNTNNTNTNKAYQYNLCGPTYTTGYAARVQGGGWYTGSQVAITGFQIYSDSGNISGTVRIYGYN